MKKVRPIKPRSDRIEGLLEALHNHLVSEKGDRSIRVAANQLGLSYDVLYARLTGRTALKADELLELISLCNDLDIANLVLAHTRFVAIDRVDPDGNFPVSIHEGASLSVIEAADVLASVVEAMRDSRLDHQDRFRVLKEIETAERTLAALRARVLSSS